MSDLKMQKDSRLKLWALVCLISMMGSVYIVPVVRAVLLQRSQWADRIEYAVSAATTLAIVFGIVQLMGEFIVLFQKPIVWVTKGHAILVGLIVILSLALALREDFPLSRREHLVLCAMTASIMFSSATRMMSTDKWVGSFGLLIAIRLMLRMGQVLVVDNSSNYFSSKMAPWLGWVTWTALLVLIVYWSWRFYGWIAMIGGALGSAVTFFPMLHWKGWAAWVFEIARYNRSLPVNVLVFSTFVGLVLCVLLLWMSSLKEWSSSVALLVVASFVPEAPLSALVVVVVSVFWLSFSATQPCPAK